MKTVKTLGELEYWYLGQKGVSMNFIEANEMFAMSDYNEKDIRY